MIRRNIPQHWKWVALDDIGIVVTGNTPSTKILGYYNSNDIPFFKPTDLEQGINTITSRQYLSKEAENIARIVPQNTVLVTCIGATIGKTGLLSISGAFNQQINGIISFINSKFLYYYCISEGFQNELISKSSSTTIPILNKSKFELIKIPLPPIEEQNRIVEKIEELFSELDKNLEQFEKRIKDVELLWTIALNKAIGDNSNLINLESLVEIKGGKRLPKNFDYSENKTEYPYIRVSDFSNYSIDESNLKYISEEVYEKLKTYSIDSKNVYISIAGTIGLVGSIPNNLSNAILTENAAKFIFDEERLLKDYLIYLLDSPFVREQIKQSIKATSQPKLALYKILKFKIPEHTIFEQRAIVDKLEDTKIYCNNLKKSINENYLATLMLKEKILQEAFQGKLVNQLNTDTSTDILLKNIQKEKEQYLLNQQEIIKNRPKIRRMEKEKLSIIKVLEKNEKPISAKQLWEKSMYSDSIEKFYSELKKIQDKIIEEKTEKGSLISLR